MAIQEKVRNSAFLVLARAIPTSGGQKTQFLGAFQNGAFIGRVMGQSSLGFAKKVPRLPRGDNFGMEQIFAGMKIWEDRIRIQIIKSRSD